MEKFIWNKIFSVGVEQLDQQHQQLFAIINKLASNGDSTESPETIGEILADMHKYAGEHFEQEEQMLEQSHYSRLEDQKKQHHYFIKKTDEFAAAIKNGQACQTEAIYDFLGMWLQKHIAIWDIKYKETLT